MEVARGRCSGQQGCREKEGAGRNQSTAATSKRGFSLMIYSLIKIILNGFIDDIKAKGSFLIF